MSISNVRSVFAWVIFLLIATAITTVYLLNIRAAADTTIIAQKKKSTKTKTTTNEVVPRINSIISTTDGYKIKGSGFGKVRSNLVIYEGKTAVPSRSVRSLNNTSINVHRKTLQTVDIRVVVSGNTSNTYKYSWKDPNLSKTKQTQKTTIKKHKIRKSAKTNTAEPDTIEINKQVVDTKTVDKKRTTDKDNINDLKSSSQNNIHTKKQTTQLDTKSKTESVSSDPIKVVDDKNTNRTIKPIIKPLPSTGEEKSNGGLNPIGRPSSSSSGGTMTAMNTGNTECNSCHLPVLESFPFWNWETSENDDTVRFVRLKKPKSGSHPVWKGIKVDGWDVQFQSSNPSVVALIGADSIDSIYMQQGIEIRGPGTATITGMSRFRSGISPDGQENWHGLPQVSRQIVVTESASQIESFKFSPNPASVPGTTQGIVTFDGGTGEQTWVKWQR
ncbi:MAG: hypothetical protein GWM89_11945, partial [Candidatus Dadabacteria bacterium]|nr:hypothetical protein [Candidatus Dadabacteria bacterium]NIY23102.1 hypothetical protein [Candidatus Dadabacteria bacterium]